MGWGWAVPEGQEGNAGAPEPEYPHTAKLSVSWGFLGWLLCCLRQVVPIPSPHLGLRG